MLSSLGQILYVFVLSMDFQYSTNHALHFLLREKIRGENFSQKKSHP